MLPGPETLPPKLFYTAREQGMASENDVILLSCLPKSPAAGQAAEVVRSALQRVLVRAPSPTSHDDNAAVASASPMPHLRAICPSAHAALVDARLLRAFSMSRARTLLARLTPLPAGTPELPTVAAGVTGDASGRCFIGQRAGSAGFSAFSIRRQEVETGGASLRIEDLIADYRGANGTNASARAVYDLCGASHGDLLGGCMRVDAGSKPFARLATEWLYSSDTTRTLGSLPPPACSSLLLVGGTCPLSPASVALRGDIETLTAALAQTLGTTRSGEVNGVEGPFRLHSDGGDPSGGEQQRAQWEADLEALLSGSENMAELAARTGLERGAGENDALDGNLDTVGRKGNDEETTGDQTQNSIVEIGAGEGREEGERFRGDLDFSEWLWELAARAPSTEDVRSALSQAFHAVGDGQIFPVISRENQTAVGRHIREGVAMTREERYHETISVSSGGGIAAKGFGWLGGRQDDEKMKAWRERGSAMIATLDTLAEAFVELGVHKVTLDLHHWFETRAGVLAADIDRVLPANFSDTKSHSDHEDEGQTNETRPFDPRLDRLITLATTLDLVALAQSCGAPWRQVRGLAHAGLAKLGRGMKDGVGRGRGLSRSRSGYSSRCPSTVFPVVLPKPIPTGARSKLAHPVLWELVLEPATSGTDGSTGCAFGATETVSYTMTTASLFQLKGADEIPVFSVGAARAAQVALEGCPAGLIPEVLSCVAGAESFAELKRRQQVLRAKGSAAWDDKTAVFVCEHRFMPW